jgi:riboflavin kinase / FMN adenylyltransferase
MRVHRGFDALAPGHFRRPVATIGVFDGIHLGHRAVIDCTRDLARELDGESVVVTFDIHPRAVVKGRAPRSITSVAHRLVLLERSGLDHAVVLPFTDEVKSISAGEFADRVFLRGMGVKGLVLGFDSRFGKDRRGDLEFVTEWARGHDVVVRSAPPVFIDGKPISSSVIRDAIAAGEHDHAQALLGRPVAVYGTIVPGSGRGREIGFGTANIDLAGELSPPTGVYAAWARFRGSWQPALVNIGTRPTFEDDDAAVIVEVHVPGIDERLHGEEMEVQFVQRIRDEERFPDVNALIAQIERDRAELNRIVGEVSDPPPLP